MPKPILTPDQLTTALSTLPNWEQHPTHIQKTYTLANFKQAFAFMTQIAFEAELLNHHPDWSNVYKKVEIKLTTHESGGITELDIELAQRIEAIFNTINI